MKKILWLTVVCFLAGSFLSPPVLAREAAVTHTDTAEHAGAVAAHSDDAKALINSTKTLNEAGTKAPSDIPSSTATAAALATVIPSHEVPYVSGQAVAIEPTTGSATFSIPINVPAGRNGIQPSLALLYNSSAKNGILGVGWSLELGAVQRSLKQGVPKYDSTDSFILMQAGSAQELLYDAAVGFYRTEIEGAFMKIEKGADYWCVTEKSGTKYYFGQSDAARQYGTSSQVFKWCLDRVEDISGNYMTISYQKDGSQIYPQYIDYTGNSVTGDLPYVRVEFLFENRPDTQTSYISKFLVKTAKRVNQIKVFTDGDLQARYQLSYAQSPMTARSLIASVTQYGADGVSALPSTTFSYQQGSKGFSRTSGWNIPEAAQLALYTGGRYVDLGVRIADVNNDGYPDFVRNYHDCSETLTRAVYLNTKNNGWAFTPDWELAPDWPGFIRQCPEIDRDRGIRFGDVNGDGCIDTIRHYRHDLYVGGQFINETYVSSQSNAWQRNSAWDMPYDTAFTLERGVPSYDYSYFMGTFLVDVNSDGYADVVRSIHDDYVDHATYLNNAAGGGTGWHRDANWDTPSSSYADAAHGAAFVDLNSDTLPDMMYHRDGTTKIYINNGQNWALDESSPWNNTFGFGDLFDGTTQFGDINGDGLLDLVVVNGGSSHTLLNNGHGWNNDDAGWIFSDGSFKDSHTQMLDANADGMTDFLVYYDNSPRLWLNQALSPDLLAQVDNGVGAVTTLNYQPSSRHQNQFLSFIIQTVQAATLTAQDQSYTTRYAYANGLWDAADKEFRGFGYSRVTDAENNYTETWFLQDDIFKGRVERQEARDSSGDLYSKTLNTWGTQEIAPGVGFVFLQKKDGFIYDGDATGRRTQEQYFYGETPQRGNLTKVIQLGEVDLATGTDIGEDTRSVETTYVSNTENGNWLIGLPAYSVAKNNNGSIVRKTSLYYDGHELLTALPSRGLLTKKQEGETNCNTCLSLTTRYSYDAYGNLTATIDPNNHTSAVTYDTGYHMFPLTVENAIGHYAVNEYYGVDGVALDSGDGYRGLWGQLKSTTDPNEQQGRKTYDTFGRVVATVSPLDTIEYPTSSMEYAFAPDHVTVTTHQREITGEDGTIDSVQFYDGLGRLIKTKTESATPGQYVVSGQAEYNSRGLPAKKYVPYFSVNPMNTMDPINPANPYAAFTYDAMGRAVQTTNPDGSYVTIAYDDWTTSAIDENGHMQKSYTDAYGRLIKKEEYLGADGRSPQYPANPHTLYAATLYAYDPEGALTKVTDAHGNITTIAYDSFGRKKSMNDQDMGLWRYSYDAASNLIAQTDAKNTIISFNYDALNRLINKTDGAQLSVNYTYDNPVEDYSKGRLTQAAYSVNDDASFRYDRLGRENESAKKINGIDYQVSRSYDAASRLASVTYPDSGAVSYRYNTAGQLASVADGEAAYVSNVSYNASGQVTEITYGNGDITTYNYNPLTLRLLNLHIVNAEGAALQDLNYAYDSAGNILSITDSINTATQNFQYDELNRLIQAQGSYGTKIYAYDEIGNIIYKNGVTYTYGEGGAGPHAVTSGSDDSTFEYDANGNMSRMVKSGVAWEYSYDAENRLVSVNKNTQLQAKFVYDGDGGRTKKTVYSYRTIPGGGGGGGKIRPTIEDDLSRARNPLYKSMSCALEAIQSFFDIPEAEAATVTTTKTTTYVGSLFETTESQAASHVYLGGTHVATIRGGEVSYFHTDHLGGTNVVTDANGEVKELIEYEPFGGFSRHERLGTSDDVAWWYFTGKPLDDETGLYYYGARYYNSALGRFITPDSVVPGPGNPQAFNRYSYCLNNPVNRIDPSGHWSWKKFWNSFAGAFAGAVVTVLTAGAGAPLWIAGMAGGMIGGATTGGLEGGWKGALIGGAIGGALGGLGGWGISNYGWGFGAGMLVAGAGVAGAMNTWDSFAGGFTGGITGGVVGAGVNDAYHKNLAFTDPDGGVKNTNIVEGRGVGTTPQKALKVANETGSRVLYTPSRNAASDIVRGGTQLLFRNSLASKDFAQYVLSHPDTTYNLHSEMTLTALGAAEMIAASGGRVTGVHFNLVSPFYSEATANSVFGAIGAAIKYFPPNLADSAGMFATFTPVTAPIYGALGVLTLEHFHGYEVYKPQFGN